LHQTYQLTCGRAPLRKVAHWKAPRSCCGISTRTRIDWMWPGLLLHSRHSGMLGHVLVMMPRQPLSLNLKSAHRKNQN